MSQWLKLARIGYLHAMSSSGLWMVLVGTPVIAYTDGVVEATNPEEDEG